MSSKYIYLSIQKYEKNCEILRLQTVLKSFYFVKRFIYRYKLKCNGDLGFIDIQENGVVEYLPSLTQMFEVYLFVCLERPLVISHALRVSFIKSLLVDQRLQEIQQLLVTIQALISS